MSEPGFSGLQDLQINGMNAIKAFTGIREEGIV